MRRFFTDPFMGVICSFLLFYALVATVPAAVAVVTWRYDPTGWRHVAGVQNATNRGYITPVVFVGLAGVAFLCFGWVPAALVLIVVAVSVPVVFETSWRWLTRDTGSRDGGEVRIGPQGVLRIPGGFLPLGTATAPLAWVKLDETTRPVLVRFSHYAGGPTTPYPQEFVTVPVPTGHIDEARALVDRFNAGLPAARRRPPSDPGPDEPFGPALPSSLLPD